MFSVWLFVFLCWSRTCHTICISNVIRDNAEMVTDNCVAAEVLPVDIETCEIIYFTRKMAHENYTAKYNGVANDIACNTYALVDYLYIL